MYIMLELDIMFFHKKRQGTMSLIYESMLHKIGLLNTILSFLYSLDVLCITRAWKRTIWGEKIFIKILI